MPDAANTKWLSALEVLSSSGELGQGKMSMIRMTHLIDVDGTLVDDHERLTLRTHVAVNAVRDAGGQNAQGPIVVGPFVQTDPARGEGGDAQAKLLLGDGGAAQTPSISASRDGSSSSRRRAAACPARLALVDTIAPSNALHNAMTSGCALTRTAMPRCTPVIHAGAETLAGTIHVFGPGQLTRTSISRSRGNASRST